jgi:hypothetical protein
MNVKALLCFGLAALVAGCGGTSVASTDSGIRGVVRLEPACPVEPCEHPFVPYVGTVVASRDGDAVAATTTDAEGRFELRLSPGRYVVAPKAEDAPVSFYKPLGIVVRPHQFTDVSLAFDSGIR